MKVWEFVSAFRWSEHSLAGLLNEERWSKPYGEYFDHFDQLVEAQDRSILESPIPLDLSRAAASLCDDLLFTISDSGVIRRNLSSNDSSSVVSALHIHDNFGGAVIEDVLEKGSYRLPDTLRQQHAEQAPDAKPDNVTS